MLEKINTKGFETLSRADTSVIKYMSEVLRTNPNPVFIEIGVGVGATTLPTAELMNNRGSMLLFSRERDVLELTSDLKKRGFTNIDSNWGSPSKIYSGYHFELARAATDGLLPKFDLAYIDGGHVFHLDAPATCILKEYCKPGGYMIFDDYNWSLSKSPSMNPAKRPETAIEYDPIQIETCHVQLVCKCFMDTDHRFERIGLEQNSVIYRRKTD